jgi:hypothetical protein
MKETETLSDKRIIELSAEFMEAIRENYIRGPVSRARAYEALNALAATAAIVIMGCDGAQGEAHEWFERALGQELMELRGNQS